MSQPRKVLLVSHAGRKSNIETAALAAELLRDAGISVRVVVPKNDGAIAAHPVLSRYELVPHCSDAIVGVNQSGSSVTSASRFTSIVSRLRSSRAISRVSVTFSGSH